MRAKAVAISSIHGSVELPSLRINCEAKPSSIWCNIEVPSNWSCRVSDILASHIKIGTIVSLLSLIRRQLL
jgi:hypothetical protein